MVGSRSRKRAKPNPSDGSASTPSLPTNMSSEPSSNSSHTSQNPPSAVAASMPSLVTGSVIGQDTPSTSQQDSAGEHNGTPTPRRTSKQAHKTRSWYGSWPRVPKSSPSTQVARETIQGGTLKTKGTVDFSRFDTKKSVDALSLDGVPESESASVSPLPPVNGPLLVPPPLSAEPSKPFEDAPDTAKATDNIVDRESREDEQKDVALSTDQNAPELEQRPTTSSNWLGWFVRHPNAIPEVQPDPPALQEAAPQPLTVPQEPIGPKEPETARPSEPAKGPEQEERVPEAPQAVIPLPTVQEMTATVSGGSWFGFWSSSAAVPAPQPDLVPPAAIPEVPEPPIQPPNEPEDAVMEDAPPLDTLPTPPPKAGSTWAFWSRDTGRSSGKKPAQSAEQGQLAIIGEGSESHPQRANAIDVKDTPVTEQPLRSARADEQPTKTAIPVAKDSPSKKSKRVRPQSMDLDEASGSRPSTPKPETHAKAESSAKSIAAKTPTSVKSSATNLLLPVFTNTYQVKENPTLIQQIAQLLLRTNQPPAKHVHLAKEPFQFKKALAIGVHGLFPANYLRPMIGQPTGTSIKFANHGAEAIRRWADSRGYEDCEIEKVALEGEGRIGERVENLWKLLLNWIDHIRKADLIIFACHSQGVPVSIMLLAKLLELGVITTAKVGVCAMAGVSLGPFPDYRSGMGILMGSAAELWEFADPQSEVSKRLEVSMKTVLNYGVRLTLIGSIDDQLVPLESAIYAPAHHPHIYRAVFIDGRVHAPDFIAHLVGFALKLRNLGVTDHGLIRELSVPLAGSLYSGEGHSRLYDDEQVYDLAIRHTLETTSVGNVPCEIHQIRGPPMPSNPYLLPWTMRGLLEEEFVKSELHAETAELLRQFDDWKPVTKALKDVKYRLEAVRSKL